MRLTFTFVWLSYHSLLMPSQGMSSWWLPMQSPSGLYLTPLDFVAYYGEGTFVHRERHDSYGVVKCPSFTHFQIFLIFIHFLDESYLQNIQLLEYCTLYREAWLPKYLISTLFLFTMILSSRMAKSVSCVKLIMIPKPNQVHINLFTLYCTSKTILSNPLTHSSKSIRTTQSFPLKTNHQFPKFRSAFTHGQKQISYTNLHEVADCRYDTSPANIFGFGCGLHIQIWIYRFA